MPPLPQSLSSRGIPQSPSQKRAYPPRSVSSTPAPPDIAEEKIQRSGSASRLQRQQSNPSLAADDPPPPMPDALRASVPPGIKRWSLTDGPVPPTIALETPSPPQGFENPTDSGRPASPDVPYTPGMESSLAALKQSEALQRRASKRFSTYTFSKMTGSGPSSNFRRSVAAGSLLTPGDLAALTEVDETTATEPSSVRQRPRRDLSAQRSMERKGSRTASTEEASQHPVPALPSETGSSPQARVNGNSRRDASAATRLNDVAEGQEPTSPSQNMTIFLQVGRQVKKVTMDPVYSFSALRVLFVDKFSYNPGQGNFPEIYIRDPSSGVQYELEDVTEVKDKCLLSLNIERMCS